MVNYQFSNVWEWELVRIQTAEEANRERELEEQVKELEQALGKPILSVHQNNKK
jgi:hypothetical protein